MSDEQQRATGIYTGVEFSVDQQWTFFVPSLDKAYPSYDAMKDAIDRAGKAIKASRREKLSLPVVDSNGVERIITGVHAGHGHLVISPTPDRYSHAYLIPRESWIISAIEERKQLLARAEHIGEATRKFEIKGHDGYGFDPSLHESEVKRIRDEFDKKTQSAKATDLNTELAALLVTPKKKVRV